MLNGIDVSSHQENLDVSATPADFVIVKVSGGTSYVNDRAHGAWRDWRDIANAVLESGKLLGLYHYACEYGSEPGGKAEAEFFLSQIKGFEGKAILCLDWESHAQQMPVSYAKKWLDTVAKATGSTPFFYCYASYLNGRDHSAISKRYPLWKASYLSRYAWGGFVSDPADIWANGSWDKMTMYQYTSQGRIRGYGGNLDLNCFYGTRSDWTRYAKGGHVGSTEKMVGEAVAIAEDDSHGYSQAIRWDPDFDCASLMYHCAHFAGFNVGEGPGKTRYTGTMIPDFTAAGFTKLAYSGKKLKRGDILLRDPWGRNGHTEMYIGDGKTVGAHSSEHGTAYGKPGDQTGNEISVGPNYGNWDYILRPPEGGIDMNEAEMRTLARFIAQEVWELAYGSDAQKTWNDDGSAKSGDRIRNNYQTLRMMLIAQRETNDKLDKLVELLGK